MSDFREKRLVKLQSLIKEKGVDWFLIMEPGNRRYYSGFSGSSGWLAITPEKRYIVTDSRYFEQVGRECPLFELVKNDAEAGKDLFSALVCLFNRANLGKRIGFESDVMTVSQRKKFQDNLPTCEMVPCDQIFSQQRMYKAPEEIDIIKEAVVLAENAFIQVLDRVQEGITEREVAAFLEFTMKVSGAENFAFDTIVAFGKNGALPHAKSSDTPYQNGDCITIDWGARTGEGYNSDMTRSFFVGEPEPEMAKIYNIVREAQQKAVEGIRPGIKCSQADSIARNIIVEAGYGEYFGHGLGHGVGLAVHEGPTLNQTSETILEPGMVVTVEPGIYVPGLGGVRIEDMVLVTEEGGEVLTNLPKAEI